jgi:hypothetical protein
MVNLMSSTEALGKDSAPAAIRYIVLVNAFACLLTVISFILSWTGASTQEQQFYQVATPGFIFTFVISTFEWFLLRRSRKIIGPYGFAFLAETLKFILFNLATVASIENVSRASPSAYLLHQLTSLAAIFMLALTKFARTRIDQLASKDISRHFLNLLPTLLILIVMMGTYITEVAGLGTPRQDNEFGDYEKKEIDWSMFNTPDWDASYLLENLMDQFAAGLQFPDQPLFNITSDQSDPRNPPAYWRLGTLPSYKYTGKPPYSTDWDKTDEWQRELSPNPNSPYSSQIPSNERTATFTVELPLDHSVSLADVTVNPSFQNQLPTTWNGEYGSYVSADSFVLEDSNGAPVTTTKKASREIVPMALTDDLLGVDADLQVTETSEEEGVFRYDVEYRDLYTMNLNAAAFSMGKDNYSLVLGASKWQAIQDLYLQLPNATEEMPPTNLMVVGGTTTSPPYDGNYSDWAPTVVGYAGGCVQTGENVFSQAYAEMQRVAPEGEFGLQFDFDMWLGSQLGATMAHPAEYEDYNEWFVREGKGVSIHFASLLTTILRLKGIPSRVVIGYLAGNDTMDPTKRVVTARFLHAWSEVLIPVDPLFGDPMWISFDPLLSYLANYYGLSPPTDILLPSPVNRTIMIKPDLPYDTTGPLEAFLHDQTDIDPAGNYLNRVNTSEINSELSPATLNINDNITVFTRIMVSTFSSWTPWYPSCEFIGSNISFYFGTLEENTTGTGLIEDNGVFLGNSTIDGSGLASVTVTIDIERIGLRPGIFYAVFKVMDGTNEVRKVASSLQYNISF